MKPVVISLVLSAIGLYAQTPDALCSNATLKGAYGIIVTGTESAPSVLPQFPSNLYPVGSLETFIGVVVHTFDGNGKFTQVDHVKGSLSGPILDRPGGGTYTVKTDLSRNLQPGHSGSSVPGTGCSLCNRGWRQGIAGDCHNAAGGR